MEPPRWVYYGEDLLRAGGDDRGFGDEKSAAARQAGRWAGEGKADGEGAQMNDKKR